MRRIIRDDEEHALLLLLSKIYHQFNACFAKLSKPTIANILRAQPQADRMASWQALPDTTQKTEAAHFR